MAGPLVGVSVAGKSIALQDLPDSAFRFLAGTPTDQAFGVIDAYARVPWIYRAVETRSQSLGRMPAQIMRGKTVVWTTDEPTKFPKGYDWFMSLPSLIGRTERALCIDGRAYWFKQRNSVKTLGFQWLLPRSITPKYDTEAGLIGFMRALVTNDGGKAPDKTLALDEVVYWWMPSVTAELGPGISPVSVALSAASLIRNIDLWSSGFFERGAAPLTLLSVEGNPPDAELRKLESWWRRLLAGSKRAFETIAVRASVKPQIIGSPPKDLAMPDLTRMKQWDIATTLGVPVSMLHSNAVNFAVAQQDDWNYHALTVIPESEMIETGLNEQIFQNLGLEFRFQPKKLPFFQRNENAQAMEFLDLVLGGVMTPDELRARLGMEPVAGGDVLRPAPQAQANENLPTGTGAAQKTLELRRWERKALKSVAAGQGAAVPFESIALREVLGERFGELHDALMGAETSADVRREFLRMADAVAA
jgi:HK97 family phage portal protein